MTNVLSQDHHPTLRHVDREALGIELQKVLVTLLDLSLAGKQAHWNVIGPHFRSLHLQLDEMIDEWRGAADAVGERAVTLGHAPDGRAATVAAETPLTALQEGPQSDAALIAAFTVILTEAVDCVRERANRLENFDLVTVDLLQHVIATLEKQLWAIRVQAA